MHAVVVLLCDNYPESVSGCIGVHDERLVPVWRLQDRFLGAYCLQMKEGLFMFIRPVPLAVFAHEIIEGACNVGKVGDERAVEITEPQEASHILDTGRGWPLRDSLHLDRVHTYLSISDDHTQVFYLLLMELEFFRFKEETEFCQTR